MGGNEYAAPKPKSLKKTMACVRHVAAVQVAANLRTYLKTMARGVPIHLFLKALAACLKGEG